MTLFEVLPPFLAAILGALVGLAVGWGTGTNLYLSMVVGGYTAPMLLLAVFWFTSDSDDPPASASDKPPVSSWRVIGALVAIYLIIATIALAVVFVVPLRIKLQRLQEDRKTTTDAHSRLL
jgi:hypothetical protein